MRPDEVQMRSNSRAAGAVGAEQGEPKCCKTWGHCGLWAVDVVVQEGGGE